MKKKKNNTPSGNRCGHSPTKPRFCDLAKRGKRGHPPVIGLICSKLESAYTVTHILNTWQKQNPSGRKRRSEIREAMISLGQYMFAQWFQLETRRCAVPNAFDLETPNAEHLVRRIGLTDAWKSAPISKGRIDTIFCEWQKAGYMTSHQMREKKDNGDWSAHPSIRTFTKKFFIELGGKNLWNRVKAAGAKKLKKIQALVDSIDLPLKEYLNPGPPTSPQNVARRTDFKSNRHKKTTAKDPNQIRRSVKYRTYFCDKVEQLFSQHPPDDPRKTHWRPQEIYDNARRITDKHFGI